MPDIFISYCHDDNQKMSFEKQGWVEMFQFNLMRRLSVYGGRDRKVDVWWDEHELQANTMLTDEIKAKLNETKLLVPILSPSYVSSEWCRRELHLFCASAMSHGGLKRGNVSCVVKVEKNEVDQSAISELPELSDCTGLAFYQKTDDGVCAELNPERGLDQVNAYLAQINKLVKVLLDTLGLLDTSKHTGVTIYLAGSSKDLADECTALQTELESWHHTVIRDATDALPDDPAEYRERVRKSLSACQISIHPLGLRYGTVPETWDGVSPMALQYEVAGEVQAARGGAFVRIPWIKPDLQPPQSDQQTFVAGIEKTDPALLKMTIEDLKTRVREIAQQFATPPPAPPASAGEPAAVAAPAAGDKVFLYLICDQCDAPESVIAVEKLLAAHYRVERSRLADEVEEMRKTRGDALQGALRDEHARRLAKCDVVLVYHGVGDALWLSQKLSEVRDVATRSSPYLACGVLLAKPQQLSKNRFEDSDAVVMPGYDDPAAALQKLYDAVDERRKQTHPA